jgi:hypothetical protein
MAIINSKDLESTFIYIYQGCGKRARIKTLKKDEKPKKRLSKKEYLESTVNVQYVDMPPLDDPDFGELKIIE